MNKAEAMEVLGISKRTLEKYQGTDRLPVRYVKGKTGEVVDFDPTDVERLKEERAREARSAKVVTSAGSAIPASRANDASGAGGASHAKPVSSASSATTLARVTPQLGAGQGSAADFADLLAESYEKAIRNSVADLKAKTSLSFPEAQIVTGVPERQLREAAKNEQLKSVKVGRALRVKTSDVITYAESLFK